MNHRTDHGKGPFALAADQQKPLMRKTMQADEAIHMALNDLVAFPTARTTP